LTFDFQTLMFQ